MRNLIYFLSTFLVIANFQWLLNTVFDAYDSLKDVSANMTQDYQIISIACFIFFLVAIKNSLEN